MKKFLTCLLCVMIFMFGTVRFVSFAGSGNAAAKPDIQKGTSVLSINEEALNAAGYKFVDDSDPKIIYGWPYDMGEHYSCDKAYGESVISNVGQVSAKFFYSFEGTFLAVAFADTYYSATVKIDVDGEMLAEVTPHNSTYVSDGGNGSLPMDSTIIFATDKLSPGSHTVTISHEAGHESGEDHVLADGNTYYDNYALFDCFIVQDTQTEKTPVDKVTQGSAMSDYTDDILNSMNLTVIDDTNEDIQYQWPYDMEIRPACTTAYGGGVISNVGQVSATFSYDFEGTFLAVAFAETYYAATVMVDVDGDILAEVTPHNNLYITDGGDGSIPMTSTIIFATDQLSPGWHTVTIYHEAGYESGEDHILSDGNAYYDNYALFDCFIVQKNPTEESTQTPAETPTVEPTASVPTPTATTKVSSSPKTEAPATEASNKNIDDKSNSNVIIIVVIVVVVILIAAAAIIFIILKKKGKGKKEEKEKV